MRAPQTACFLSVFACLLATASAKGQEARNAQGNTLVPRATVTAAPIATHVFKRQDAVPTVTVDDPKSIQTGTDGLTAPLPTGNSVSLIKNDDGSVDFLLGPDVQTGVEQAAASSCAADQGPSCQEAVQQVLHQADFGVQSRQVGLLVAAAGIALASFANVIIFYYTQKEPIPVRMHMSPPTVSQISSLSSATSVVMTTSGESSTTLAVPVETDASQPPDGSDSAAVSADINEAGDLVLNIKEDSILQWLQNEAHNNAQCASSTKVKRQAIVCNIFHGQNAIGQMNPGGTLADLLVMPHIPQPQAADVLNAAVAIFQAGKTLLGINALTEDVLWDIAYFLALFYSEPGAADAGATITVPASDINPDAQDPDPNDEENNGCPTGPETPACEDSDCQGDPDGAATCVAPPKTSCSCAVIATPVLNTDGDVAWLDAQQTEIAQMVMNANNGDSPGGDAKPTCDKNTNGGIDPGLLNELAQKFCGESDLSQDAEKELGQADLSDPETDLGGISIKFSWKHGDGSTCAQNCVDSFASLNKACQYDSHTFTGGGSYESSCGTYGLQVVEQDQPPETTDPPPGPKLVCNSGDAYKLFSRDGAESMMRDICQKLHDKKVVLSESGDSLPPSDMDEDFQKQDDGLSADGSTLVMNPNFAKAGCDDPNNPTDVDFGAMSVEDCVNTWLPAMDGCPNFEKGDSDFWKIGGQAQAKCAFWTIYAQ